MKINSMFPVLLVTLASLPLQGCKWNDDFRDRLQPEYQEREVKKTLNRDSDDYVGDAYVTGRSPDDPKLESIDELSDIPELPEQPGPMNR